MGMHKKGYYTTFSAESEHPFTSDELRFVNRFKEFYTTAQPPQVPYEIFHSYNDMSNVSEADLFNSAKDHFDAAQKAVEAVLRQEVKMSPYEKQTLELLMKSAKTNSVSSVVCSRLAKPQEKEQQTPFFDFSISKLYPVVKPPKKK